MAVPNAPQAPGEILLSGEWKMVLSIPDCQSKHYKRLYTYNAISTDSDFLQDLTETRDFPDFNSIAACNVNNNQIITPLTPYHVNQRPIQFKEMMSLKLGWAYDGIKINEFTSKKIIVERTVNFNNTGDRVWTYTLSRIPPLTEVSDSVLLVGEWNAAITMLGCTQTYDVKVNYYASANDPNILDHADSIGNHPSTTTANRCASIQQGVFNTFPVGYPTTQTAKQFKEMIEIQTWDKVVIDTWSQNQIILIRTIIGTIPSENAELTYTLTKL